MVKVAPSVLEEGVKEPILESDGAKKCSSQGSFDLKQFSSSSLVNPSSMGLVFAADFLQKLITFD